MVFSSWIFCFAFLPANLLCYFFCKTTKTRNFILLAFSLVFYAWGEPVFIAILALMALFCWLFSRLIDTAKSDREKKLWLAASVAVCLGAIGYFKYIGFAIETVNGIIGADIFAVPQVTLPIGISFYTFQLLTYVIDVYRGEVPSQKSYWRVLLYASLFHQCIAGPIVRYGDVENELTNRTISLSDISTGLTRFSVGLAKKAVLANSCGAVADTLLLTDAAIGNASLLAENVETLVGRSALSLWVGMAFYMLQIYLDFSSYSDMAIGMGLMCGFHYKENFNYPYIAASVTDFWRRWHMSLSTFFRDYVYIPLGGNRKGKGRQILNLFIVWGLTGLWHGASWNFVLWGLYFFVLLVLEKFVFGKFLDKHKILGRIYLLATVYFGWVFFKFTDFTLLGTVFKGMLCLNSNPLSTYEATSFVSGYIFFLIICAVACTPVMKVLKTILIKYSTPKRNAEGKRLVSTTNKISGIIFKVTDIAIPVVLILLAAIALVGDSYNPFLYFQF